MQNQMRGVLAQESAGAARWILDSANHRDKSVTVGCVHHSENKRAHSQHDDGAQVPQWKSRKPVVKNLDKTVRFQFEKHEEWIRAITGKRLQAIVGGISSAPRLASSSAALFPMRNECPGTLCILIEK